MHRRGTPENSDIPFRRPCYTRAPHARTLAVDRCAMVHGEGILPQSPRPSREPSAPEGPVSSKEPTTYSMERKTYSMEPETHSLQPEIRHVD